MGSDPVHSDSTVQPGTEVSERLWRRFREDVKARRGRVNGVLGSELENAIRAYLDASNGRDTALEVENIAERLERIEEAVLEEGPGPSRDGAKNKNSRGKDSGENFSDGDAREEPIVPTADGGIPVDDRALEHDVDEVLEEAASDPDPDDRPRVERVLRRVGLDDVDEDRPVTERRTDAAVAELVVSNSESFMLAELDEAIERGAGVSSKPSVRKYRERVLDRLGGVDAITHPEHRDRPIDRRVFFLDVRELARLHRDLERDRREEAEDDVDEEADRLEDAEPGEPPQ